MRRKLFTAASVLSLLLCVATVGLWVRSYWAFETLEYEISHYTNDWDWKYLTFSYSCGQFHSTAGHHFASNISHPENALMTPEGHHFTLQSGSPIHVVTLIITDWHGFFAGLEKNSGTDWYENSVSLGVPAWFATAVTALLPLAVTRQKLKRRLQKHQNRCFLCSYNLL